MYDDRSMVDAYPSHIGRHGEWSVEL